MIRRSDKQNLGSGVALNTCMNNSRCLAQNVVLLFNIQFRCQNVLVTGKLTHYEICKDKIPMHRNMLVQKGQVHC